MKPSRGNSNGSYSFGSANGSASLNPNRRSNIRSGNASGSAGGNALRNSNRNNNPRSDSNNGGIGKSINQNDKSVTSLFNLNDELSIQHMNDRFNFLLVKSIGEKAIATVGSGARYKGTVLAIDGSSTANSSSNSSSSSGGSLAVVLSSPELFENVLGGDQENDEELPKEMVIESKDLMDLELLGLDLSNKPPTPVTAATSPSPAPASSAVERPAAKSAKSSTSGFKTDTDISGNLKARERDLQRWTPEEDDEAKLKILSGGLEDDNDTFGSIGGSNNNNSGVWDQFAVNEKKFGVQSSWDENLYTTRLRKDDPDFMAKYQEADKIAREIESQGYNGNIHLAEERGINVDDSGMDEEDKYSGVDRRGSELMAALKSGLSSGNSNLSAVSRDNALPSATNGKYIPPKQRNEVHNLDPAIISSMKQLQNAKHKASAGSAAAPPTTATTTTSSSDSSASSGISSLGKENEKVEKVLSVPDAKTFVSEQSSTTLQPAAAAAASKQQQQSAAVPPPPPHHQHHHHHHNHHNHNEHGHKGSFRSDDIKLSAQQEINALKEFSANFKIPQKFPTDLLPILSKDKQKQEEIIKKANASTAYAAAATKKAKELQQQQQQQQASSAASSSQSVSAGTATTTSTASGAISSSTGTGSAATGSAAGSGTGSDTGSGSGTGAGSASTTFATEKLQKVELPPKPTAPSSVKNSPALRGLSTHSSAITSPKQSQYAATNVNKPVPSSLPPKKRMDPRAPAFKLNPAAASFTPSASPLKSFSKIGSPARQNANIYNNNSSAGSINNINGGRHKRNNYSAHQFFSASKIPKADGNRKTLDDDDFNFVLKSSDPIEKAFQTPPTWGSTVDESYKDLYPTEVHLPAHTMTGAAAAATPRFFSMHSSGSNVPNGPGGIVGGLPGGVPGGPGGMHNNGGFNPAAAAFNMGSPSFNSPSFNAGGFPGAGAAGNFMGAGGAGGGFNNAFNPMAAAAAAAAAAGGGMPPVPGMPMMPQAGAGGPHDSMLAAQYSQFSQNNAAAAAAAMMAAAAAQGYPYGFPPQFAAAAAAAAQMQQQQHPHHQHHQQHHNHNYQQHQQFNPNMRPYGMPGAPVPGVDPVTGFGTGTPGAGAPGGYYGGGAGGSGANGAGAGNTAGGPRGGNGPRNGNSNPNMSPQVNYGKF